MNISGQTINDILEKHGAYPEWCAEYGEPGYDTPEHGIFFANWNNVPRCIGDWLEHHGYATEWSDEWIISYETNKAYRSSPDSYGWKRSYVMFDNGDIIGRDEIENGDQIDEYIAYLLDDPSKADTFDVDWTQYGFIKLNADAYESGFHPGQTDNPKVILQAARKQYGPDVEFIFSIDDVGQFDVNFSLWMRAKETDC
jgi:hypothetical protein